MSAEEEALQKAVESGPKIAAYDLEIQVLELRHAEKRPPNFQDLLDFGMEARKRQPEQDVELEAAAAKIQAVFRGNQARTRVEGIKAGEQDPSDPNAEADAAEESARDEDNDRSEQQVDAQAGPAQESPPVARADTVPVPTRNKCRVQAAPVPTFSYFESEQGLQFLLESGGLEPDRKVPVQKKKDLPAIPIQEQRTPWNPRLVDEEDPDEVFVLEEEDEVDPAAGSPKRQQGGGEFTAAPIRQQPDHEVDYDAPTSHRDIGHPKLYPERPSSPVGPHPDKKSSMYDVYGVKKDPPKAVPKAYVSYNKDFLEVESAVDRRVRTASIAHKKNATHAPSVSAVRKSGSFLDGSGVDRAAGVLNKLDLPGAKDNWQLTSTMQGLGDPTRLVDVSPGICRFGPLRAGCVYRMAFYLRNLDVDTTRFNVARMDSAFVNVKYSPQLLAPGMAAKIVVEIVAGAPARVEQLIEVRVKAHVVQVPVTARIFEADEYDRLDADSMNMHGRHIGRLRKGGPIELVTEESYCKKVLGERYKEFPDHLSWQMSQEDSMMSDGLMA